MNKYITLWVDIEKLFAKRWQSKLNKVYRHTKEEIAQFLATSDVDDATLVSQLIRFRGVSDVIKCISKKKQLKKLGRKV